MIIQEKSKKEIETKSNTMSEFLRMEYLERCLEQNKDKDLEIKKFCTRKLSELYEGRRMYSEAAKYMTAFVSSLNVTREKVDGSIREAELWIKAERYDNVDVALKKILMLANSYEKFELKKRVKEAYILQAQEYEKSNKNSSAVKIYERILPDLTLDEKREVQKKLLRHYEKLGKIKEYSSMKREIEL
jgi:hypothetical protein